MITTPYFKMIDVKSFVLTMFHLKANRFTGSWETFTDESHYGITLTESDKCEIWKEAVKSFAGLTLGGIKSIFDKVYNVDLLADWGMANGHTYTKRYQVENVALYFCAGEKFSNPHHKIRRVTGRLYYESAINWNDDHSVVEEFNKYLAIQRLPQIGVEDLSPSLFVFLETIF